MPHGIDKNSSKPIWDQVTEIKKKLSNKEMVDLPSDLALNYNYYNKESPERSWPAPEDYPEVLEIIRECANGQTQEKVVFRNTTISRDQVLDAIQTLSYTREELSVRYPELNKEHWQAIEAWSSKKLEINERYS